MGANIPGNPGDISGVYVLALILECRRLDPTPAQRCQADRRHWEWEAVDGDTFGELALFNDLAGSSDKRGEIRFLLPASGLFIHCPYSTVHSIAQVTRVMNNLSEYTDLSLDPAIK